MARVRKGETVVVRAGEDSGKRGRVLRVFPAKGRVLVEGVNLVFKHLKKSQKNPQGGRVQRENWVPLSSVMPIDPSTDAPTRVAYRIDGGRKVRVARRTGTPIEGASKGRAAKAKPEGQS